MREALLRWYEVETVRARFPPWILLC
jgi:hypothetical protein